MKTQLEIFEQELINEPNILNMSFTILSDHSVWGQGKRHIQDNNIKSGDTLCGKSLGFAYETEQNSEFIFLNKCTKEDVLAMNGVCKICIKRLDKK